MNPNGSCVSVLENVDVTSVCQIVGYSSTQRWEYLCIQCTV